MNNTTNTLRQRQQRQQQRRRRRLIHQSMQQAKDSDQVKLSQISHSLQRHHYYSRHAVLLLLLLLILLLVLLLMLQRPNNLLVLLFKKSSKRSSKLKHWRLVSLYPWSISPRRDLNKKLFGNYVWATDENLRTRQAVQHFIRQEQVLQSRAYTLNLKVVEFDQLVPKANDNMPPPFSFRRNRRRDNRDKDNNHAAACGGHEEAFQHAYSTVLATITNTTTTTTDETTDTSFQIQQQQPSFLLAARDLIFTCWLLEEKEQQGLQGIVPFQVTWDRALPSLYDYIAVEYIMNDENDTNNTDSTNNTDKQHRIMSNLLLLQDPTASNVPTMWFQWLVEMITRSDDGRNDYLENASHYQAALEEHLYEWIQHDNHNVKWTILKAVCGKNRRQQQQQQYDKDDANSDNHVRSKRTIRRKLATYCPSDHREEDCCDILDDNVPLARATITNDDDDKQQSGLRH